MDFRQLQHEILENQKSFAEHFFKGYHSAMFIEVIPTYGRRARIKFHYSPGNDGYFATMEKSVRRDDILNWLENRKLYDFTKRIEKE